MKTIFSLLFLIASATIAQTKLSLTPDEAIRIGLEKSKSLHSSLMDVQYADARSAEVNALRMPTLKLAGNYTRLSDVPPFQVTLPPQFGISAFTLAPSVVNNYTMRVSLQQPLFTGFKLSAASAAAGYSVRAAEQDYAKDKTELIYNIRNAYWSLYKAMEFKKVADENVEQVKAHLKDAENLLAQGMVTRNDVLKVQVQLSEAQLRQIDAKNNVRLALLSLNNVLGIPLDTQIELATVSSLETEQTPEDLRKLLSKAFERRPEIKAMEYRIKAGEEGVTAARSGWFPQIYLAANYNYARPNQRIQPVQDVFKDTWDVGVTVSLDIWNWGTTAHQTDQAEAQLARAKDAYGLLKDGVELEITQTYLNLTQAGERIGVAETGVTQAEENYRITSQRFKEGLALNSDLLDAEVALMQAKWSKILADVDYHLAQARLQKAVGE
jgi:outer membrane protein